MGSTKTPQAKNKRRSRSATPSRGRNKKAQSQPRNNSKKNQTHQEKNKPEAGQSLFNDLEDRMFSKWQDGHTEGTYTEGTETLETGTVDSDGDTYKVNDRYNAQDDTQADDDDEDWDDDHTAGSRTIEAPIAVAPRAAPSRAAPSRATYSETTHTGASSLKFPNTLQSLAPRQNMGVCLISDFQSIVSWDWKFTTTQFLSGLLVVLNQVPECISYAYIAGMDPFHALQATWISNVLSPLVGGRPGMMCGSSGLGAIAIRFVVSMYGPEYVFYAVLLSGFGQVLFGGLRIGKYLRLLPPGITIGMVNALCLLLVALQLRYFKVLPGMEVAETDSAAERSSFYDEPTRHLESTSSDTTITEDNLNMPWAYFLGYDLPWTSSTSQVIIISAEAFCAMAICHFLPRYITAAPSSLIAIVILTCANIGFRDLTDWVAPTVGDYCTEEIPTSRYWQGIFHSSYNLPPLFAWDTLTAVAPAGLSLFCINLLETMMAINVTDKYTVTDSEQDRVFYGQGVSNLACGIMAGMSGTGMAHTSLYGLRMGGVTSISVFFAGIIMLCVLIFAYPAVAMIPLGAVMGVTLYLIWNMIQWSPMVALILKCTPDQCLILKPRLLGRRLVTPDLFATFVTSIFALCSSTYGFAGYLIGVLCYACDPIGHAVISGEGGNGYNLIEMKLSKPSVPTKSIWQRIVGRTKKGSTATTEDSFLEEEYIRPPAPQSYFSPTFSQAPGTENYESTVGGADRKASDCFGDVENQQCWGMP